MGGLAKIRYRYHDSAYAPNHPLVYRTEEVDAYLAKVAQGEIYYSGQTDLWIQEAFAIVPVRDRDVVIIGSRSPWFESVCLFHGGRPVTIDYNPIRSDDARLRTMTVAQWEEDRLRFDCAVSISSVEHSGLGRYGEPLDPDGDLRAMEWLRQVVKPMGVLFLSVPVCEDEVCFNDYRRYGAHRLPKLLSGWKQLGIIGWDGADFAQANAMWSEPVFVLQNG